MCIRDSPCTFDALQAKTTRYEMAVMSRNVLAKVRGETEACLLYTSIQRLAQPMPQRTRLTGFQSLKVSKSCVTAISSPR